MKLRPADVIKRRPLLVVAAVAAAAGGLIGVVDAVDPLPVGWVFARAGLGLVLEVVLLVLLVRWVGERQQGRGTSPGRFASLSVGQQRVLAAAVFVAISLALVGAGFLTAVLARP